MNGIFNYLNSLYYDYEMVVFYSLLSTRVVFTANIKRRVLSIQSHTKGEIVDDGEEKRNNSVAPPSTFIESTPWEMSSLCEKCRSKSSQHGAELRFKYLCELQMNQKPLHLLWVNCGWEYTLKIIALWIKYKEDIHLIHLVICTISTVAYQMEFTRQMDSIDVWGGGIKKPTLATACQQADKQPSPRLPPQQRSQHLPHLHIFICIQSPKNGVSFSLSLVFVFIAK